MNSRFTTILSVIVIAANTIYATVDSTVNKWFVLAVYFIGITGAAVGKGWERLNVLQSKPLAIAGTVAAGITAFLSADPAQLNLIPGNLKSGVNAKRFGMRLRGSTSACCGSALMRCLCCIAKMTVNAAKKSKPMPVTWQRKQKGNYERTSKLFRRDRTAPQSTLSSLALR